MSRKALSVLTYLALGVALALDAQCDDWPTWRYDAGRTAACPQELPAHLYLQWARDLPAPRAAWPRSQTKLQFDASYEPVVMGKTIFVPSTATDSLTAYSTETGEERWRFYADGPVRFAPAAYKNKLLFACDDGCLYCLDAQTGALLWKFRGGPDDRRVIGNDRLVSMWPARGAPVVYDGKVYFAAGIWPFMGIFIHALDADSGEVVWTNSGSGSVYILQQHTSPAFAGVAPQGCIAATENRLMISGGRTVPAAYDRETGELLYYHLSSRQFGRDAGGHAVTAVGGLFFNGGAVYELEDGRGLVTIGRGVYTADAAYFAQGGEFVVAALPPVEQEVTDAEGNKTTVLVIEDRLRIALRPAPQRVLMKAGSRVYCARDDGTVMAVDLRAEGGAAVSWQTRIDGTPWSMLAADDKLFVVTREGQVLCFGGRDSDPKVHALREPKPPTRWDRWAGRAARILKRSNVSKGYCLVLGAGSGRLIEELYRQSGLHIIAVDPDAAKVRALRERLYDVAARHQEKRADEAPPAVEIEWPRTWQVLGALPGGADPLPQDALRNVPRQWAVKDKTFLTKPLDAVDGVLDFSNLYGGYGLDPLRPGEEPGPYPRPGAVRDDSSMGQVAYAFARIDCPADGRLHVGAGSDWWMAWYLDGEPVYDTLEQGNTAYPFAVTNHVFAIDVSKGEHVLAVMVKSGSASWMMISEGGAEFQDWVARQSVPVAPARRLSIHHGDPFRFPFPPYLADLIVSEDLAAAGFSTDKAAPERIFEPLRPYGGTAWLPAGRREARRLLAWAGGGKLPGAEVSRYGGYVCIKRPGPLPGAAPWTHQYADSANTVVSADRRVRAPLGLLWFGGPPNDPVLPRHGHGPSPQVVGGRLFIEGADMMRAVDVYTGRLLWERELPGIGRYYDKTHHQPGAGEIGSNYVSMSDGVYVMSPLGCLMLDPPTGRTLKEFALPAADGSRPAHWGSITVWNDSLVATASPISVPLRSAEPYVPLGMVAAIEPHAQWQYLAGAHPEGAWTAPEFQPTGWKLGEVGLGFADNDDKTVLADMQGAYSVVYARRSFHVADPALVSALSLIVSYDDAFIAYLNGKEVARAGVVQGSGPDADGIAGHEAGSYDPFEIARPAEFLREGENVLAIEGHNAGAGSSDFSLDPYLAIGTQADDAAFTLKDVPGVRVDADYAPGSGELVVMDRHSGDVRWSRRARHAFRHNAIAVAAGKVFCIDRITEAKLAFLGRRGLDVKHAPVIYALDAADGHVVWQRREDVFGTWLGYSRERDILLQAGSRARDRAADEAGLGMVAYRGADGTVLWRSKEPYSGPCMLHHDTIITQGGAFDLLTGGARMRRHPLTGETIPWTFTRNYGCNTVIASEHLLTFRSAAAGFFDLDRAGGTGNLGGFKSGCTSNMIVADGVLNVPDYTRTCTCSYQNQASLAFVHMPDAEVWTFNSLPAPVGPVRRFGINLGAPGDRMADNGTLWLEYPVVGGPSPSLPVALQIDDPEWFRFHSSHIRGDGPKWVAASGVRGAGRIVVGLAPSPGVLVPTCEAPPTIDGDLGDACWADAQPAPFEGDAHRGEPLTALFIRRDDRAVYFGYRRTAPLSNGKPIPFVATQTGQDSNAWMDDDVELFVTDAARKVALQFGLSCAGGRFDGLNALPKRTWSNTEWSGQWHCAVRRTDTKWTAEMAIPYQTLRAAGLSTDALHLNAMSQNLSGRGPKWIFFTDPGAGGFGRCQRFLPVLEKLPTPQPRLYTVRLHFAEPEDVGPGHSVFDVALGDEQVLKDFDVVRAAGGPRRAVVREFKGVEAAGKLAITLTPSRPDQPHAALLCGLEVIAEGW